MAPGCGRSGNATKQHDDPPRIENTANDAPKTSLRDQNIQMDSQLSTGPDALRILPLNSEAISRIHSSKHITTISGVVLSLIENSLDAQASKIDVVVDFNRGGCVIDDNGIGISSAEFRDDGGLAKMYFSSKQSYDGSISASVLHGSHGIFLAQLSALSLLIITSKHSGGDAVLKVHHGQVLQRTIPQHRESHEFPISSGTSVEVRDIFGNMPVRVKQRAIAAERSDTNDKTWQSLKHDIVALLLAWPHPCRVSVRDAEDSSRRFTISAHHPYISGALTSKSLDQLAGRPRKFDLQDVLPILFQAAIAPQETRQRWIPLSAVTEAVSLKGVICLDPAPSKHCQFIAVGIQPSIAEHGHNVLYDCVNKAFANSSFGHVLDEVHRNNLNPVSPCKGSPGSGMSRRRPASDRKGVDRFAMFCLQLDFKGNRSDLAAEYRQHTESSLSALVSVLEAAITEWLTVHHFGPRHRKRRRNEQQEGSPTVTPKKGLLGPMHISCTSPSLRRMKATETKATQASGPDPIDRLNSESQLDFPETSSGPGVACVGSLPHRLFDLSNLSSVRSGTARRIFSHKNVGLWQDPGFRRLAFDITQNPVTTCQDDRFAKGSDTDPKRQSRNLATVGPSSPHDTHPSNSEFGSIDEQALLTAAGGDMTTRVVCHETATLTQDNHLDWMDPLSGRVHKVNARTGVVIPSEVNIRGAAYSGETETPSAFRNMDVQNATSSFGCPLISPAMISPASKNASLKRLPAFLEDWDNPVFIRQKEAPIRALQHAGLAASDADINGVCFATHVNEHRARLDDESQNSEAKLSRMALSQARVIGQVDQKFILCEIPRLQTGNARDRAGKNMILIDQHAASERIILEELLQDLCSPMDKAVTAQGTKDALTLTMKSADVRAYTTNSKPLFFEISDKERELLIRYRGHFEYWGIVYDFSSVVASSTGNEPRQGARENQHSLRLTNLPPTIAKRCATLPQICISMIRTEIWALNDGVRRPTRTHAEISDAIAESADLLPSWLQSVSSCPPGILNMLNSRACRSAIMFNDPLSIADCEALVARLASCVFPFVCAHGRVSMVPLADIGNFGDYHEWE